MAADDPALRERVSQLEAEIDTLTHGQARLERGALDAQGRRWTLGDFMAMGLTRRQALGALGSLAMGASLGAAITGQVRAQPTGDEGQVGQSGNRVEVWASEIDATEVATATIVDSDTSTSYDVGDDLAGGISGVSTDAGLSLGGGYTVVNNNPCILWVALNLQTDGSVDADVAFRVDESGGSTADYSHTFKASSQMGSNAQIKPAFAAYLPGGATVELDNQKDPTGFNTVNYSRYKEV